MYHTNGLTLCSVLVPYSGLAGFWTFMYRVSPMNYLIGAMLSNGVALQNVECSDVELLMFSPPANMTCETYAGPFLQMAGGTLQKPQANDTCLFCPVASTDTYLATLDIHYSERWRNFGLIWVYVVFNVFAALAAYWLMRVPKKRLGRS